MQHGIKVEMTQTSTVENLITFVRHDVLPTLENKRISWNTICFLFYNKTLSVTTTLQHANSPQVGWIK